LDSPTRAAEKSAPAAAASTRETVLRIANGKISGATKNGQPVPAALGTIAEMLREAYRDASITLVEVDEMVIENLTLRLAPRTDALRGALAALAEGSGRKFRVQNFGERDFLLIPDRSPSGNRFAEVFNLTPLLSNNRAKQSELRLRDAETRLAVVQKVRGPDHPGVADIKTEIAMLKAHVAEAGTPTEPHKIIEQIETTVKLTLALLKSTEKSPEFSYHPGTQLLIVIGGDQANEITRKVVAALEKGAN
jgi:hypothetical protein